MSATLVRTDPGTCGVATTVQAVPFQWAASEEVTRDWVARPTAQAPESLAALTALRTVLVAPVTAGPGTWDQEVLFHRAVSGVVADRSPTAQASASVRAETALKKPPSDGGDGTTVQPDAPAGLAPSSTVPTAASAVAKPSPRMCLLLGAGYCRPIERLAGTGRSDLLL